MLPVTYQELRSKFNICLGITAWKRKSFLEYVGGAQNAKFKALRDFHEAVVEASMCGGRVICWASSAPTGLFDIADEAKVEVILVEDGFVRSSGLGIKLNLPASLCFSREGIHYDARVPSNLEGYLETHQFTDEEEREAEQLVSILREKKITKYNLKEAAIKNAWPATTAKKILAIGQVGDDASLRYGSLIVKSNHELLHSIRMHSPGASIVYRPHPDVVSGLRVGEVNEEDLRETGAVSIMGGDLISLMKAADEVHVASSQAGLEACLHGVKVVCHGQPFYAGWGLTEDIYPVAPGRRGRHLTIAQMIYGAFIAYPTYVDPYNGQHSDVFQTIRAIEEATDWPSAPKSYLLAVWLKRRGFPSSIVNLTRLPKKIRKFMRKLSPLKSGGV